MMNRLFNKSYWYRSVDSSTGLYFMSGPITVSLFCDAETLHRKALIELSKEYLEMKKTGIDLPDFEDIKIEDIHRL